MTGPSILIATKLCNIKKGENRDDLFFTVICDLDTRKVIWVSSSRRKEALDEFFLIIGKKACEGIDVVACDQHNDYAMTQEKSSMVRQQKGVSKKGSPVASSVLCF